nr:substrate-binding domain-containing protein [Terrimicrobiaceae bacterium]
MRTSIKKVTQADIARSLGLSPATVALVVGNSNSDLRHRLRKATVQLIMNKAQELGYRPNQAAQMTRSGRSNLIVHLNCGGYSELSGQKSYYVGRFVHETGYDYQVIDSYWWGGEGEKIIDRLLSLQPEGIVVSGSLQTAVDFEPIFKAGIPVVGMTMDIAGHARVRQNVRRAIYEITAHCLRAGRLPALVLEGASEPAHCSATERELGFLDAVNEAGFRSVPSWELSSKPIGVARECPLVIRTIQKRVLFEPFREGMQVAQCLLDQKFLPGALVCTNDFYAIGAMTTLVRAGVSIPEDVMVSGFDNLASSTQGLIPLTTVEQPVEAMCRTAVRVLKDRMDNAEQEIPETTEIEIPCRVLWRASTEIVKPPRRKRKPTRQGGASPAKAFSLLELMLAIAIVATFSAMLIPAIQSARQSAYLAGCLNNLRQLGMAANSFSNDHDGYVIQNEAPDPARPGEVNATLVWPHLVAPYLDVDFGGLWGNPNKARKTPFVCPAEREVEQPWQTYAL